MASWLIWLLMSVNWRQNIRCRICWMPVDVAAIGCDYLAAAGQNFYVGHVVAGFYLFARR